MPQEMYRIFRDRPCKVCNEVPEEGYNISQLVKYDWRCPKCHAKMKRNRRMFLKKKLIEGGAIKISKGTNVVEGGNNEDENY